MIMKKYFILSVMFIGGCMLPMGCINSPLYMPVTGINFRSNDEKANNLHSSSNTVTASSTMDGPSSLALDVPLTSRPQAVPKARTVVWKQNPNQK